MVHGGFPGPFSGICGDDELVFIHASLAIYIPALCRSLSRYPSRNRWLSHAVHDLHRLHALCNVNHRSTRACSYHTETFVGNQQMGLPKHSNGVCHRSMAWAAPRLGRCCFRGNGAEVGNSTWWRESELGRPSSVRPARATCALVEIVWSRSACAQSCDVTQERGLMNEQKLCTRLFLSESVADGSSQPMLTPNILKILSYSASCSRDVLRYDGTNAPYSLIRHSNGLA